MTLAVVMRAVAKVFAAYLGTFPPPHTQKTK